jgi:hypothetical protein
MSYKIRHCALCLLKFNAQKFLQDSYFWKRKSFRVQAGA